MHIGELGKRIFILLVFLTSFLLVFKPALDPDAFWHIKQGSVMLASGRALTEDVLNSSLKGLPWADYYWLSDVLMAFFYERAGGFVGLSLIFAVSVFSVFFLILRFLVQKLDLKTALSFMAFSVIVSFIVGARPQTIGFCLFGLLVMILDLIYGRKPWMRSRAVQFLEGGFFTVLFSFWANTHASFVMGVFIVFLFCASVFLEETSRGKESLSCISRLLLFLPLLFSLVGTFITPYGVSLWKEVAIGSSDAFMRNNISEWMPVNFHDPTGFLFVSAPLTLFWAVISGVVNLLPWKKVLFLVFSFWTLYAVRFEVVFLAIFFFEYITSVKYVLGKLEDFRRRLGSLGWQGGFVLFCLVSAFFLSALSQGLGTLGLGSDLALLARQGGYPFGAVSYLKERGFTGRVFNTYHWGGFFAFYYPSGLYFIDGRMPTWKSPLSGESLLREYTKVYRLEGGWRRIIEEYRFEAFLVEKNSSIGQAVSLLPSYAMVYEDDISLLFVKSKDLL